MSAEMTLQPQFRIDSYARAGSLIANRYFLKRILGFGGTGEVYEALDRALDDKQIALKILYSHLLNSQESYRSFCNEVLITRRLSHEHILQTYGFGVAEEGQTFMTMEYVCGWNLRELLSRRPGLPWQEKILILFRAARAIAFAHRRNVLHCDIKPHNLMITEAGEVKVADFGIARMLNASEKSAGRSATCQGTPVYMSPEQLKGETLDEQSDVYSFGVTAYETLVESLPFDGSSYYEIAKLHLEAPIPVPERLGFPDWLFKLILSCMAKQRSERLASLELFAQIVAREMSATSSQATFGEESNVSRIESTPPLFVESDIFEVAEKFRSRMVRRILAFVSVACLLGYFLVGKILWLFVSIGALAIYFGEKYGSWFRPAALTAVGIAVLIICLGFMPAVNARALHFILRTEVRTGLDLLPLKRILGHTVRVNSPDDWFGAFPKKYRILWALGNSGMNVNMKKNGSTLLHYAAMGPYAGYIPNLIESGVRVDEPDAAGRTAAQLALLAGRWDELDALVKNGASLCGFRRANPLLIDAIKRRDCVAMQILLKAGALRNLACVAEHKRRGDDLPALARSTNDEGVQRMLQKYLPSVPSGELAS